jgi:hypothetical protein
MTDPVVLWLSGFCTGIATAGCLLNRTPRDRDPDWRRSFTHENTKRPSGPPPLKFRRSEPDEQFIRMDEGRIQRGNTGNNPTTPKPEIIPRGQWPGGYQPRPQQGTPNPPLSEP